MGLDFPRRPVDFADFAQKIAALKQSTCNNGNIEVRFGSGSASKESGTGKRVAESHPREKPQKRNSTGPRLQTFSDFYTKSSTRQTSDSSVTAAKTAGNSLGTVNSDEHANYASAAITGSKHTASTPHNKLHLPLSVGCPSLLPPELPLPRAEFPLQQQAFDYVDSHMKPTLRVFAKELSGNGKRRFFVTTPARLWSEDVESASPGSCHLYEIIREGAPCNLYFDLEYVPEYNPGLCGDELVDELVELVAEELQAAFNIRMPIPQRSTGAPTATHQPDQAVAHGQTGQQAKSPLPPLPPQQQDSLQLQVESDEQQRADPDEQQMQSGVKSSLPETATGRCRLITPGPVSANRSVDEQRTSVEADALANCNVESTSGRFEPQTDSWCDELGCVPVSAADAGAAADTGDVTACTGSAAADIVGRAPDSGATFAGAGSAAAGTGSTAAGMGNAAADDMLGQRHARDAECSGATASGAGHEDRGCSWVWELCSTTAAKFSRHLIVRIPHCAFKDNFHVNAFVRRLFDRIGADQDRFRKFFVRRSLDPSVPPTLFIDPAVYTRNRAFRLYLSSKFGKTAVLHATRRHAVAALLRRRGLAGHAETQSPWEGAGAGPGEDSILVAPNVEALIAQEVFFSTLVTSMGRVDRILTMYDDTAAGHGDRGSAMSLARFHESTAATAAAGARAGAADLMGMVPRLPLPGAWQAGSGSRAGGPVQAGDAPGRGPHGEAFRYGPSPFPMVEQFIESVCCEGGVQGRVRCWQYIPAADTLVLAMRDNRWCANVGRPHRSNGIYYTVDLRGGVWQQRCYDPDCRNFRSAYMPLPQHLWGPCLAGRGDGGHPGKPGAAEERARGCDGVGTRPQLPIVRHAEEQSTGGQPAAAGSRVAVTGDDSGDEEEAYDMLCIEALERLEQRMPGMTGNA